VAFDQVDRALPQLVVGAERTHLAGAGGGLRDRLGRRRQRTGRERGGEFGVDVPLLSFFDDYDLSHVDPRLRQATLAVSGEMDGLLVSGIDPIRFTLGPVLLAMLLMSFAFAVWALPADNPWMTSVREAAAEAIDVPPPDPEAPGPFRYAGAEKLLALLAAAGFGGLEVRDWQGLLPLGGGLAPSEAADFALQAFAAGDLVAEAGEAVRDRVRRSLTERFARHEQDGAVRMAARVHIVTGMAA